MRLDALLDALDDGRIDGSAARDAQLLQVAGLLKSGHEARNLTFVRDGMAPWTGPCLVAILSSAESQGDVVVPVSLGPETRKLLRQRLAAADVHGCPELEPAAPPDEDASAVARDVRRLLQDTRALTPEARSARLMDFVMDRTDASRCALVPFEAGCPGAPLAFHARGRPAGSSDPRRIPRAVLSHVAATRQAVISHDVDDGATSVAAGGTISAQRVRSYMAVPVVFRGDLLGVAYLDHLDSPRRFRSADQATFEAFAYELARPLFELREERRRAEFDALSEHVLARGSEANATVSRALEGVLTRAMQVARHRHENLLILGETGTGKEWLARRIHAASDEPGPFVAVNVGALSQDLFESELMGSMRGAFTGAVDREGRAEDADGGTLFLDEIGELSPANQVKLLRFLEDKLVRRVGGTRDRRVDVRVIAATNRSRGSLERGSIRQDLLHRFAPPIEMPPLRERRDEIVPLALDWLALKACQAGRSTPRLTDDAREYLLGQPWPGNVRQLQAIVGHAFFASQGSSIGRDHLAALEAQAAAITGVDEPATWDEYRAWRRDHERAWLQHLMARHDGKVASAARAIGCPGTTLRDLLKSHGMV